MASRVAGRFLVLLAESFAVCSARADNMPADGNAAPLVQAAAQAALSGDAAQQFALLRKEVLSSPDSKIARWQLGQMKVGDEWLSVEEAQRRAAADPLQTEYRERCAKHGQSAEGQLALARWCRKNDLNDEARFHWASVLVVDPNNEEALRATGLRWHGGRLLSKAQVKAEKERARALNEAQKRWASTISRWRRAISGTDVAMRAQSLDEVIGLKDPEAILPIEEVTLGREAWQKSPPSECRPITNALLEALERMPAQAAAESLVRHALLSPYDDSRAVAIAKLKQRELHEYVPLLLSGLAMPIESSFQVRTEADGSVHYWHSLYREGPDRDWAFDLRRSAVQHDAGVIRYTKDVYTGKVEASRDKQAEMAITIQKNRVARRYNHQFGNRATATENAVAQWNASAESLNLLVIGVLRSVTGKDLEDSPKAWWDWWEHENEYYASDEHPTDRTYDTDTDRYYYGGSTNRYVSSAPPPPPTKMSCFAKGTLVWTKTGKRPIETLNLGELVLAQDVASGELAYKPVIGRTVRPPSPLLKIDLRGEQLRTTLGHPFFVAGAGWQMAKKLADGAVLHGIAGSQRVVTVGNDGEEEAYNLVVADFNNYFVGGSGVLVHDNTPRQPTRAILPGLAAK